MKLIDVADPHFGTASFHPQTRAQLSSCTPVVDYHHMRWDLHCSERFQTNALFLWPSPEEKLGFDNLWYCEFGAAGNPQVGEHNEIN